MTTAERTPEVSFVLPCLDEAETLGACLDEIAQCIAQGGYAAEVIVADNGSRDGSQRIARERGARVVEVAERGYGSALRAGFLAARGRYLVMGDSDLSYDFREAPALVELLRGGCDLAMGSRFRGRIEQGAMPWKHRWLGNPVLSWIGRRLFAVRVSDFHCGLRALSKDAFLRMHTCTSGMEFASELVVRAALSGMHIGEAPVTLRPDGRSRAPHLRSFRDGWRHLRYLLCMAPRFTLALPGLFVMLVGLVAAALTARGTFWVGAVGFDIGTLVAGALALVVGYQWVTAAIAVRLFAHTSAFGPASPRLERAFGFFRLELGLAAGALCALAGLALVVARLLEWRAAGYGRLDPSESARAMIGAATLIALGAQTVFASFVYSMYGLQREVERGGRA
ncbi:MAG: glycosyltransferase family 2 protein [Planctomycetota bacterium]|nr:MAG: glycosyltransferase family 2 protein [Planctomycetota bacterium]